MRRQRRLGAHHAALAFEALEQRRLLAADIGAGADADLDVEIVSASRRCRAEAAIAARRGDRRRHRRDGVRIFRADVDDSPWLAPTAMPAIAMPSISRKGSPSMIMRSAKVPESPSSALQTTYFRALGASAHGAPFDAGRESRAAAAAQARIATTSSTIAAGPSADGALEPAPAAMGAVIGDRQRVGDAAAREGEPRLPREERHVFRAADPQADAAPPSSSPPPAGPRHRRRRPGHRRCGPAASRPRPSARAKRGRAIPSARCRAASCRVRAAAASAAATSSAPTASAPASRGNDRCARSSPRSVQQRVERARRSSRPTGLPSSIAAGAQAQRPRQ